MEQKSISVLLIDDDSSFVGVIKHLLGPFQGTTFETTWMNDGDKAIEHLRGGHSFDIILMDYYLPAKTGVDVARQIRDAGITTPIIILTANKDYRTAIEALKFGVEDYILKEEISESVLARTVVNVLNRCSLRKQLAAAELHNVFSRERNEAVKQLVVTMCHEFNNPLAAIKISAAILARNHRDEREKSLLSRLNENISLLEQQINRLRDLEAEK